MNTAERDELRDIAILVLREQGPTIAKEATVHTLTRLGFELEGPNAVQEVQRDIAFLRDARPVWPRLMDMLHQWESAQGFRGSLRSQIAANLVTALMQGLVVLVGLGAAFAVARALGLELEGL